MKRKAAKREIAKRPANPNAIPEPKPGERKDAYLTRIWRAWNRDRKRTTLRDFLLLQYQWIAHHWALKFNAPAMERDDWDSIADYGIFLALDTFKPTKGATLRTHVTNYVRYTLLSARARVGIVPAHAWRLTPHAYRAEERLTKELQRKPTDEEIAAALSSEPYAEHLPFALQFLRMGSLDAVLGEDQNTGLGRIVPDYRERPLLSDEDAERLRDAIRDKLDARRQRIIELRFFDRKTLGEVGVELGITRKRVRQIEVKALKILRESLSEADWFDVPAAECAVKPERYHAHAV